MKPWQTLRSILFFVPIFLLGTNSTIAQIPGQSYFDGTGYIEYIAGDYPLIISVPHGGYEVPNDIADRNCNGCVYSRDSFTQEIGRSITQYFFNVTGHHPHVIINLLDRTKLDTNRPIGEGADGDPKGEQAWTNYQNYLETAKTKIIQDFGRGLLIDLHGHGHPIKRIELGYILTHSDLNTTDEELNTEFHINRNSTKNLVNDNVLNLSHSELVRGPLSFGALLQNKGYPTVPSPDDPYPEFGDPYFNGGYIVYENGAHFNNNFDAFQIEADQDIRINGGESAREQFSELCAFAIKEYLSLHYGVGIIDFDEDGAMSDVDCDDFNAEINPNANEIPYNGIDDDCDPATLDDDLDQDGFNNVDDCDDTNPNINPDAVEIPYNGVDDDCDPATLDDDLDQDGFNNADDCNDNDPNINPDANEIPYNGVDDDCDPATLDDDLDQDGFNNAGDCDDSNANINPDANEIPYNGVDDDCDPATLDDDLDQDGFNQVDDCDDTDPNINPNANEIPYNGIDDDCDPATLDDDLDQDGFNNADDCEDTNPNINPSAEEILDNQVDENCDGIMEVTASSELELEPEQKTEDYLIIYPNPANQVIHIEKADKNDFKVEIFDVNNRLVLSDHDRTTLNVSHLSSGMYFLIYHDLETGKKTVKKWIVLKK
ncbi:MAG: MopE-related protein [Allomuricauda sp.]